MFCDKNAEDGTYIYTRFALCLSNSQFNEQGFSSQLIEGFEQVKLSKKLFLTSQIYIAMEKHGKKIYTIRPYLIILWWGIIFTDYIREDWVG